MTICSQGHSFGIRLALFYARSKGINLKRNSLAKMKIIPIENAVEFLASTESRLITYIKIFYLMASYSNQSKSEDSFNPTRNYESRNCVSSCANLSLMPFPTDSNKIATLHNLY